MRIIKKLKFKSILSENKYYLAKHHSLDALKYLGYFLMPTLVQNKISLKRYPSIAEHCINLNNAASSVNKLLYNPISLTDALFLHFESKLEHLLKWEDLNSMYFSIESRLPFLDYRLVEATLSTPSSQKINKGETKIILREALKDILPTKIILRKDKKSFSSPRDKWFRTEKFKNYIYELIDSESFKHRGYFNPAIAKKQYEKHLKEKVDCSKEIWKWINLELWFRKFID